MKLEYVLIALLISGAVFGLYLRNAPFTGGNIDVEAPPLRTSYDVFANTEHVKWIYDSEQSYYLAPARAGGINAINAQNPLYYVLIATFTKLTNISPYQTTYLVLNLLSVFIVLCVFVIANRAFGINVAIVSAFFGFFPQAHWLFPMYIGFQYDYHTYTMLAGVFFLLVYMLAKKEFNEDLYVAVIAGILLAGIVLSHYSELFFFAPFIGLVTAIILFFREYSFVKKSAILAVPFIIAAAFFLYYYPLTLNVHLTGGFTGQLSNQINPERARHLDYFPWPRFNMPMNLLAVLGIITIVISGISGKVDKKRLLALGILVYILFVGTSNYTLNVWANRAERQLFLGHSFFVMLPALGIIGITTLLTKNNRLAVLAAVLISIISIPYLVYGQTFNTLTEMGRLTYFDDDKWNAVRWIRDNTPKDARVFFINGYIHEFQMFAERVELKGDLNLGHTQENIKLLCSKQWPDTVVGDWGFRDPPKQGFLTRRLGWNKFDYALPFQNTSHPFTSMNTTSQDKVQLSFFDYVVVQHTGNDGFDQCMQWFVAESNSKNYTIIFSNQKMAVLKKEIPSSPLAHSGIS